MPIGERPADAAAPIVAGEMKSPLAMTRGCRYRHRIVHQPVDVIIRGVVGIRPRVVANSRAGSAPPRDSRRPPARPSCARQQCIDSAKPCSSSTSGAPGSPAARASKVRAAEMGEPDEGGHERFPSADGDDVDRARQDSYQARA